MHAFDTLKYTKGAEMVGIKREHAEYQAEQLLNLVQDELATKKDIEDLKSATKKDIEEVRKDLKEVEYKLTIRLGLMMFVSMGLIITILSFIIKH